MDSLLAGKTLLVTGLGIWLVLSIVNHLRDFAGTLAAVAAFMQMSALDNDPAIPTPLKRRAIHSPTAHRAALIAIILMQAIDAALFGLAALYLVRGKYGLAQHWMGWSFVAFSATWLVFFIAGSWFASYIRQDGLQRTHLLLLAIGMVGLALTRL